MWNAAEKHISKEIKKFKKKKAKGGEGRTSSQAASYQNLNQQFVTEVTAMVCRSTVVSEMYGNRHGTCSHTHT